MSEFKGTQGIWEYNHEMVISIDKEVLGNIICDAPSYSSESNKNWEANAKLISCAPEMLEMLKELINLHELGHEIGQYDKALELIKKATL